MNPPERITRLRDLSPQQWKSGIAAWLGWMFDGLDIHLYTLGLLVANGTAIDVHTALLCTSFLFIPAGVIAFFLPHMKD